MITLLLIAGCSALFAIGYGVGHSVRNRVLQDELAGVQDELERTKAQHKEDIANVITVTRFHFAKERTKAEHMHQLN